MTSRALGVLVLAAAAATAPFDAGCGDAADSAGSSEGSSVAGRKPIKTVFMIVLENHDWKSIQGNGAAPYINTTLLPQASYALNYRGVPGLHPSEPNYLWLEAGDNFGITSDHDPEDHHQATTDHLVSQLTRAGLDWRSYQEDIDGKSCPLEYVPLVSAYVPRHNPMVYFDDVTGGNDARSATCIQHVRPFGELASDLRAHHAAAYNFITPNLCHDMHGQIAKCLFSNLVHEGDRWLSQTIPMIQASQAYKDGGAIFITFDENEGGDAPIGMIVLSPLAKGHGYTSTIEYTHSSTLRTFEEIFGVPPLRAAATSNDLRDLFVSFP